MQRPPAWIVLLLISSLVGTEGHGMHHRHLLGRIREPSHRACGSAVDERAHNALMAKVEETVYGRRQKELGDESSLKAAVLASPFPLSGLRVKIQFHVVHWKGYCSTTDISSPPVDDNQLARQIAVLNADYKQAGLQFEAGAALFHEDQGLAANCFKRLPQIYNSVVINPASQINVIICDLSSSSGILGVMPEMPNGQNEDSKTQVVAIDFRTLPGGPFTRYSMGRTLTHELGHYMGLLHTFGTCDDDPDGVADTPMELDAASGCPMRRDTCPNSPGTDPVWSFMDYSDDACMQRFSAGQIARIQAVLLQMRPRLVVAGSKASSSSTSSSGKERPNPKLKKVVNSKKLKPPKGKG